MTPPKKDDSWKVKFAANLRQRISEEEGESEDLLYDLKEAEKKVDVIVERQQAKHNMVAMLTEILEALEEG